MQFVEFQNKLGSYPVFSLKDIRKIIPDFSYRQLGRWGNKGYLKKIKRGFYSFVNREIDQNFLFYTANRIYNPSYISLEKSLKFYGLIPEEIFQITSVSTKKTVSFGTVIGNFSYRHIKPSLFWGYRFVDFDKQKMLFADPEKAMLDYLYLHPNLKTPDDFREMRINAEEFGRQINIKKFYKYLGAFENESLAGRAEIFLTTIQNDNS